MTGRPESGPDRWRGPDDRDEDRDNEDNDNNPNINDGRPSTHPYRCEWTAGAMDDDDDMGIGAETLLVSGESLRWQRSCCVHRTTTRIQGCVGHGTGRRLVGDMKPFFFCFFFFISLSSPARSQRDVWPQFFSRRVFNSASLVFRQVQV